MRYGHITASKAHEVSVCHTPDGSLVSSIMGAKYLILQQWKEVEIWNYHSEILVIIEKKKITLWGLFICQENPMIAVSPDGLLKEAIVEIKCPMKSKTKDRYIKNGVLTDKCNCRWMQVVYTSAIFVLLIAMDNWHIMVIT